jgi:FAD:protein FMN transferase
MHRARPLLGTFVEITFAGPPGVEMEAAVETAFAAVATVHSPMSFHDEASTAEILWRQRAVRHGGGVHVTDDLHDGVHLAA